MKFQPHFCDVDEPLKEGVDLQANCGARVAKAHFIFLWDNDLVPEFLSVSMTRLCPRCARLPLNRKYVYGIAAGEEMLHLEDELEAIA
jgi:hypothetical protein